MSTSLRARIAALSSEERDQLLALLATAGAGAGATGERRPENTYPLCDMQRVMWAAQALAPASSAYNVGFTLRVVSPLRLETLRQALGDVARRHGCLRAVFRVQDGAPAQVVGEVLDAGVEEIDGSSMTPPEVEATVRALYERPFDLARGPVFRVTQLTRAEGDAILLLAGHHLVVDLWSIDLIIEELLLACDCLRAGRLPAFQTPGAEYAQFVRRQQALLDGPERERLWAYWGAQLGDAPPALDLPTDRCRPPLQTFAGATHSFVLDPEVTAGVKRLASEAGTVYVTLLAIFQVLLHRHAGTTDVVVGSPVSWRPQEFTRTVGCMINFVPLRGRVATGARFRDFLRQVSTTVLGALEHQAFPYGALLNRLRLPHDPSRPSLVQVGFSFESARLHSRGARALSMDVEVVPFLAQQEGQFELYLQMAELSGVLHGALRYRTDLFDSDRIRRMADDFRGLVSQVVADPDRRIEELSTPAARQERSHPVTAAAGGEAERGAGEALRAWWRFHRMHQIDRPDGSGGRDPSPGSAAGLLLGTES